MKATSLQYTDTVFNRETLNPIPVMALNNFFKPELEKIIRGWNPLEQHSDAIIAGGFFRRYYDTLLNKTEPVFTDIDCFVPSEYYEDWKNLFKLREFTETFQSKHNFYYTKGLIKINLIGINIWKKRITLHNLFNLFNNFDFTNSACGFILNKSNNQLLYCHEDFIKAIKDKELRPLPNYEIHNRSGARIGKFITSGWTAPFLQNISKMKQNPSLHIPELLQDFYKNSIFLEKSEVNALTNSQYITEKYDGLLF